MKRLVLPGLLSILMPAFGQTNATDVTVTDCAGNTHNLFTELDAGKIIVVGWTMPCSACQSPLASVANAVSTAQASNPGMIEFWLNDDFANTSCQSVMAWSNSTGITNAIYFSAAELSMLDYGTSGMPKAVILGCTDHKVYYNVNNNPGGPQFAGSLQNAINDVNSGCQLSSLDENGLQDQSLQCIYETELDALTLTFAKVPSGTAQIEIYSVNGERVFSGTFQPSGSGNQMMIPTSSWNNGHYFIRVQTPDFEFSQRAEVIR